MPLCDILCSWLCRILRLFLSYRTIIFLSCVGSAIYLIWILLVNRTILLAYAAFDAIAFNGRMPIRRLRVKRSSRQKYIYFNTESSVHFPITDVQFDDYFNWTSTYRLDSDIPYPYILIKDKKGDVVGPRINMEWEDTDSDITETLDKILTNKNKAAVWFVSSCDGKNEREIFAEMLKVELKVYNLSIDVYGNCGTLSCPRENQSECNRLIEKDYYFYLSFENSCAEHYVTEKLLVPLQNNAVPIVFGGANYSNYLPPGSYLNAKYHSPKDLAAIMASLIDSPKLYRQYFRWKNHYTYHNPFTVENVCALCAALNNETKLKPSSYKDFRKWWNNDDSFEGKLLNRSTTTVVKEATSLHVPRQSSQSRLSRVVDNPSCSTHECGQVEKADIGVLRPKNKIYIPYVTGPEPYRVLDDGPTIHPKLSGSRLGFIFQMIDQLVVLRNTRADDTLFLQLRPA